MATASCGRRSRERHHHERWRRNQHHPRARPSAVLAPGGSLDQLAEVLATFTAIARGAALQTGTTVEIEETAPRYLPSRWNAVLGDLFVRELQSLGVAALRGEPMHASSDIANVSQVLPADYIAFPVTATPIAGHSVEMREAAVSELAHRNAELVTVALASAAKRIASDAGTRESLRS